MTYSDMSLRDTVRPGLPLIDMPEARENSIPPLYSPRNTIFIVCSIYGFVIGVVFAWMLVVLHRQNDMLNSIRADFDTIPNSAYSKKNIQSALTESNLVIYEMIQDSNEKLLREIQESNNKQCDVLIKVLDERFPKE